MTGMKDGMFLANTGTVHAIPENLYVADLRNLVLCAQATERQSVLDITEA